MAKKCCVPKCKSNYYSKKRKKKEGDGDAEAECEEEKSKENAKPKNVPVYRFPAEMSEKMRWIAAIPRVKQEEILSRKDPVVCQHHWPSNFRSTTVRGKTL